MIDDVKNRGLAPQINKNKSLICNNKWGFKL